MDPVLTLLHPTPIVRIFIQFSPFYPYTHCTNNYPVISLLPPKPIVQIWIQFSPFYALHALYKFGSSSPRFTPFTHCTNIYPVLSLLPPTHFVQIFIQFSPFYPPKHIVQIWIQFSPFYPYTHCTNNYPVLSLLPLSIFVQCPVLSLLPPTHIVQIWIQFFPFYPLHPLYKYGCVGGKRERTGHTLYKYLYSSLPFTPYTHCTNNYPVLSLLPTTPIVQIWIQFCPFYPLNPLYKYGCSG